MKSVLILLQNHWVNGRRRNESKRQKISAQKQEKLAADKGTPEQQTKGLAKAHCRSDGILGES